MLVKKHGEISADVKEEVEAVIKIGEVEQFIEKALFKLLESLDNVKAGDKLNDEQTFLVETQVKLQEVKQYFIEEINKKRQDSRKKS